MNRRDVGRLIYADNAATTKLDPEAFEAMKEYLLSDYGNASQPYSFARSAKKALKESRKVIADCVGASPEEIYFTSGGTESDNWVIKEAMGHRRPRKIITSEFEHHAILHACDRAGSLGDTVTYLRPTKEGFITPQILNYALTPDTSIVSVMMVNNEIGTIQPIKELCALAHEQGAIFHTDAVQAVGHLSLNISDLNVDLLSSSAHKFNGPKGIGFLYIHKGTHISSYENGGAQENGMRAGTENVASIVGMAVALKNNLADLDVTNKRIHEMEDIILGALTEEKIDYIRNGDNPYIPGNMSLSFEGFEGEMLLHRLDLMGIMVSTGSACDSKNTEISHVLRAIGTDTIYAIGTIRITLSKDNTKEEAIKIAQSIIKIIKGY